MKRQNSDQSQLESISASKIGTENQTDRARFRIATVFVRIDSVYDRHIRRTLTYKTKMKIQNCRVVTTNLSFFYNRAHLHQQKMRTIRRYQ